MITNEMRIKIDKECVEWYQAQQEIKKDEKSEHKYRFQNFVWLDEERLKSIYPKEIPLEECVDKIDFWPAK